MAKLDVVKFRRGRRFARAQVTPRRLSRWSTRPEFFHRSGHILNFIYLGLGCF